MSRRRISHSSSRVISIEIAEFVDVTGQDVPEGVCCIEGFSSFPHLVVIIDDPVEFSGVIAFIARGGAKTDATLSPGEVSHGRS